MQKIFYASSLREAIQQIHRELGPDATIIRTREVRDAGGDGRRAFEVTASGRQSEVPGPPPPSVTPAAEFPPATTEAPPPAQSWESEAPAALPSLPDTQVAGGALLRAQLREVEEETSRVRAVVAHLGTLATAPEALRNDVALLGESVRLAHHRGAPADPLAQPLLAAGVEPTLARTIAARTRSRLGAAGANAGATELASELARCFRIGEPLWGRPERTVAALVGPSASGKTTVCAKLGAEAAYVYRRSVALVSVAPQSSGSYAALRAYAEALGLPFAHANGAPELERCLQRLADVDLVLVDTPPTNPWCENDCDLLEARLGTVGVERHLVLPPTWRAADLRDMLRCFERSGIASIILSRLDETRTYGPLVTATWNSSHPLSHFASGDEVPGGILAACAKTLARQVLGLDAFTGQGLTEGKPLYAEL
jgi:flagellar biosynthesis protein FlhF